MTKKKLKPLSKLKKEADKHFSLYIRTKYASKNGIVKCVTCGKVDHYKKMHAGHYVTRNYLATRWDERNVFPQCPGCNIWGGGKHDEYALFLIDTFGPNILQELNAKKKELIKMKRQDYEKLIATFAAKNATKE